MLAALCLSVVSWIVLEVRNATKEVYAHQLRRESLDVRFTPKQSSMREDIVDGAKTLQLKAQRSFSESMDRLSVSRKDKEKGNHSKTNSAQFEVPDVNAPPALSDDSDTDQEDVELNKAQKPQKPISVTTPNRSPERRSMDRLSVDRLSVDSKQAKQAKPALSAGKMSVDDMTVNEKQLFKLSHSVQRMRNLLICLLLLVLVLLSDSLNQYIYFGKIARNPSSMNKFANPSIAQVVVLYLSLWSFIQSILLIYTWIPDKQFKLEMKRRASKQSKAAKNQNGDVSATRTATEDDSTRTVPM